jgi:site-specific DNA recombinase
LAIRQRLRRSRSFGLLHIAEFQQTQIEQATSYDEQVDHYTEYIKKNPDWTFAGIYADDGISGTGTKKREEFLRMIDDCMAGKIDLVVTKSISRFARNTIDCLKYIRQLKAKNIPVIFEKENINTMDSKGEVLITIMASLGTAGK